MIIENEDDVTRAVLGEMHRTPDPRHKEIFSALVKHLHAFVREVKLTEKEFQQAVGYVNSIGKATTPSHNEAMLLAGSTGVSNLICFLNNTQPTPGQQPGAVLARRRAAAARTALRCCRLADAGRAACFSKGW